MVLRYVFADSGLCALDVCVIIGRVAMFAYFVWLLVVVV